MNKLKILFSTLLFAGIVSACKDDLDVLNPNQPDSKAIRTETGIISFGEGVYITGFKDVKYYDGVPGYFWSGAIANHELMGDVIGTDIANIFINQIGCPDEVTLDNGSVLVNPNAPSKQVDFIRITANVNSTGYQNSIYYEWAYMYNINNLCNTILSNVDLVNYSGDAETKKSVLRAWAYWWKGYAYSRIGSIYYAGLILDNANGEAVTGTNGNYVTKEAMIAEANSNLDKAAGILSGLTVNSDYTATMQGLIPAFNRVGRGGVLSPAMWVRNINTLKARNVLVNTRVKDMTPAKWNEILTLTASGVTSSDYVFTGRTNATGDFLAPTTGSVSAKTAGTSTYKISERLIQDFKAGDKRFTNNFKIRVKSATDPTVTPYIGETSRGNAFFTRWELINRGAAGSEGEAGVIKFADQNAGGYELFLASSYEENALMRAEALIHTASIDDGLALVDAVRTYQGSALAAVSATGLTFDQAVEELRKERRIGLLFRALSFYDARRWGVIDPVSAGGGRKNAIALSKTGVVSTNATINYNFLDYWDVPDNEIVYNPPAAGSAPTTNPR
ncbi:RagB/SusD family nutrient uptake outer membrane protein [Fulvivirgaceae bacterium PWU4]|uniref:RagB/SusD family nutrient uptake outer membrane protein n=1 Tax=Chryseosolibacter histidini TaxID=2782349 RepID=A0AAP2DQY1_9BACT|nr:RagB/SusD family nutrient uptake outer membrane protein [Chryseosolibacter histidini]MBT1700856.1 RagB/SusD family nutrient uptake outer membrane protein [Chryseosolibacter histidini]